MIQELLIGIAFVAALGFVASLIYKSFQAKNACASGCGKCGASDLAKVTEEIEQRNR